MKWDSSLNYEQHYVPPDMASLWSSAVCYFSSPNGVIGTEVVNFDIQVGADTFKSDLRAWRSKREKNGKELPQLSRGSLAGFAALVLFGPDTDAARAVKVLRKMADLIEARGLVTGYNRSTYWQYEYVDGKTRK